MSTTFSSVDTLMTSLRIQSLAQQIISNNIANSATRGYSRQIPVLSALAPLSLPAFNSVFAPGQVGTGVTLASIERVRDSFLGLQIRGAHADQGRQQALQQAVDSIKLLFPELNAVPGAGLVTATNTFFADFTALAAAPTSGALRATLVTDAQAMTGKLNDAAESLRTLQLETDARVRSTLTQVAALVGRIASANGRIALAAAAGGSDNADLDMQDQAITDLSSLIKVDAVRLADGEVLVMTGNARELVRGTKAALVTAATNVHEPQFAGFGLRDPGTGVVTDITGEIHGGALAGQVAARDGLIADQRLELDELANALVTQVNLLHQAGYAQDGVTTDIPFFAVAPGLAPSEARDISVNAAIIANPGLVAASRLNGNGTDGEVAKSIGLLSTLLMNATIQSTGRINNLVGTIDPTVPLNQAGHTALNGANPFASNAADFLVAPAAAGTLVVNGVSIAWTNADSIDTLIGKINNPALGLGVRASFDFTRQRIALLSTGPLTVFDAAGNLSAALRLETRVLSLAPVNNGIGPLDRPVSALAAMSAGTLDWRTPPTAAGSLRFDWQRPNGTPQTVTVNWTAGQTLAATLAAINAALAGAGAQFTVAFTAATQQLTVTGTTPLPSSAAAPLGALRITDVTGNLGFTFNLEAQPAFGSFTDALLAQVQAQSDDIAAARTGSDAVVSQLEVQQDAIAKVNLDEEKARMLEYLRGYEASVRAMAAMDEMLNTLINRMAVGTFSGSPTASVLTS